MNYERTMRGRKRKRRHEEKLRMWDGTSVKIKVIDREKEANGILSS